jgi:hypothetical protein
MNFFLLPLKQHRVIETFKYHWANSVNFIWEVRINLLCSMTSVSLVLSVHLFIHAALHNSSPDLPFIQSIGVPKKTLQV